MILPDTMRAVAFAGTGGPEVLTLTARPVPVPGPDEILVRVAFAGVNRPDVMQRRGLYAPPPGASDLPGLEASGEVVVTGLAVSRWKAGDAVCALLPGGGYAEYALTHQDHALPVPAGVAMEQAAALPEAGFVFQENLLHRGALKAGEVLLVQGGTSGIGSFAIQAAAALGARVFATAGSRAKCEVCRGLGAEMAFNYRESDFVAETLAATSGRGADVILDMVGGGNIVRSLDALAIEGRLVLIAFPEGPTAEVNFARIMLKRQMVTGSTMRPQSVQAKARIAEGLAVRIWPLVANGRIRPRIDSIFPLREAAEAHRRIEAPDHIGKILLRVAD